jgi:hypothetical protein
MPKVDIDYSNTLFYKISCKDTSVSEVYIGHTTNFVQRKSCHKQSCNNSKAANHDCKLYKFIRDNGGWDNWRMDIVAYHECNDHYAARKKEQELFLFYKATLNSIEPMPRPKPSRVVARDINPIKSTHTSSIYNNNFPYVCVNCEYATKRKKDYNKHLLTSKHLRIKVDTCLSSNEYRCECGKVYQHQSGLCKHKHKCKGPTNDFSLQIDAQQHVTHPLPPQFDAALVIELLKQNQEFSKLIIEQNKQLILLAKPIGNQPDN